jgi:acetyltransferase-like isoleucine patch superfamily enzyme
MSERFAEWCPPEFDDRGMTKWNWMCQYRDGLVLGRNTDIGAFTYVNARFGVEIQEDAQIGSHCSIYSWSTIDDKKGKVLIRKNAKVGTHSVVMPGVTVGENAIVGAFSFVTKDVPDNATVVGVPARVIKGGA